MTSRKRLVPTAEVEAHITLLQQMGIQIGAVDIRAGGITVFPPPASPMNDYDRWVLADDARQKEKLKR